MEYTLKKCQEVVDEWIQTIGIRYFSELTNVAILMEEVGELARIAAREYGDQSYKESDKSVNLAEEMADVLFVLVCLANQTGVDLEEAFRKSIEKKTKRDKVRHRGNAKLFPGKTAES
ncbi:MAG: nucleotide pyrophosphohydrolase [Candidatus Poribacteria bacterium]|nr:nucleotide pyrophosphohydrolase [Candidatus Poribacteria bacterium]MDE0505297.1 nucleotide pyrophosphohydrolase [Candidatus Poribacteria bacterium]